MAIKIEVKLPPVKGNGLYAVGGGGVAEVKWLGGKPVITALFERWPSSEELAELGAAGLALDLGYAHDARRHLEAARRCARADGKEPLACVVRALFEVAP